MSKKATKAKAKRSKKPKIVAKKKVKSAPKAKAKPAKKVPAKKAKVKIVAKKAAPKKVVAATPAKKEKVTKPISAVLPKTKVKAAPVVEDKKPVEKKKSIESKTELALPKLDKPMEPRMPVIINKLTLMPIRQEGNLKAIQKAKKQDPGKTRYSDKELKEFKSIIESKLEDSRKELALLQAQITNANDHGTDDTAGTFKVLEDGSDTLAKEEAGQMAARQRKFIEQLEAALGRIENKTYGICRVTGKLIPKERLRAVPHTTQSIEAKLNQYRD